MSKGLFDFTWMVMDKIFEKGEIKKKLTFLLFLFL